MCTKAEVREVIRESATPAWVNLLVALFSMGIFGLLSWLSYSVHEQDSVMATSLNELNKSYSESLGKINVSNATLAGKLGMLTTELKNIREITITQTKFRSIVVDERCKNMSEQMRRMEKTIEKHHRIE